MKFYDLSKINKSESIPQKCFHWSRTKVGGSKTLRYRRSLNHKLCRPGIGRCCGLLLLRKRAVPIEMELFLAVTQQCAAAYGSMFWCRLLQHLEEKSIKCMGFGGSMVARLKLKGIDGRAHQEWSLRLNLTQHGETYQGQIAGGLTDWGFFLDLLGGGAWSFLVGGVNCLVNSDNERDLNLLNRSLRGRRHSAMDVRYSAADFLKGLFMYLQN